MAIVAGGAAAAAAVGKGVSGAVGASNAAGAEQSSASLAQAGILNGLGGAQQILAPIIGFGQSSGITPLAQQLPTLTAPFQDTQAQLAATPGYQFALAQGLQGTQNSAAAQGLGTSGAALAGAANYATGLAGTTFQNQFSNYLAQNAQIFNQLFGVSQLGAQAAGQLAGETFGSGTAIAGVQQNLGNSLANLDLAQASSIGSIFSGLGNAAGAGVALNNQQNIGNQLGFLAGANGFGALPSAGNEEAGFSSGGSF